MPTFSGGGGLTTTVTVLTDAQIKALPTVPVAHLAAPGAGEMLVVVWSIWALDARGGAYTNRDVTLQFQLGYGTAQPAASLIYDDHANGAFADATAVHLLGVFTGANNSAGEAAWMADRASTVNTGVVIAAQNGVAGNLTGGDASNSLTVTTAYTTLAV